MSVPHSPHLKTGVITLPRAVVILNVAVYVMCSIKLALPPEEEIDLFIGFFPVAYNSKSNKRQLVSLNEQ